MAQKKISELTETTSLSAGDLFAVIQDEGGGTYTTKKVQYSNMVTPAPSGVVLQTTDQTINGTKTFTSTIAGSVTGNAGTVTNGVYNTGDQSIAGIKTFTSFPVSPSGYPTENFQFANKQYVDNNVPSGIVLQTGDQTIGGNKTFSSKITGSISGNADGNAGTVTNGVYNTGNQSIDGIKTFSSFPVSPSGYPSANFQMANKQYVDSNIPTDYVHNAGNETVNGIKTFTSLPVLPSGVPTQNFQVASKQYVDDKSVSPFSSWSEVSGDLLPSVDNVKNIGSAEKRVKDLYLGPTSLHLGTLAVTDASGSLKVGDAFVTSVATSPTISDDAKILACKVTINDNFGTGADGDLTVATGDTYTMPTTDFALITADVSSGSSTIPVPTGTNFAAGQEILIIQNNAGRGATVVAGAYDIRVIDYVDATHIYLTQSVSRNFYSQTDYPTGIAGSPTSASKAQVVRIRNYDNVAVNGTGVLTCPTYDDDKGGILVFRVKTLLSGGGTIDAKGKGFGAGDGTTNHYRTGAHQKGFYEYATPGACGGLYAGGNGQQGGQGGNATAGRDSTFGYAPGGLAYGSSNLLTSLTFGGGGGWGTGGESWQQAPGGSGGGIILIYTPNITFSGAITADANAGSIYSGIVYGGSGAGGSILIYGTTYSSGTHYVTGGTSFPTTGLGYYQNYLGTPPTIEYKLSDTKTTDIPTNAVLQTGNQSIAGVKTFTSFPVLPSGVPSANFQTAPKQYVDDADNQFLFADQVIRGTKTFTSFPVTPSGYPSANFEMVNKQYVDDAIDSSSKVGILAVTDITSSRAITNADNGKVFSNYGATSNVVLTFDPVASLKALGPFEVEIINEVGAISATGGTVTTDGNYKVHSFTTSGSFILNSPATVSVLVIGAGGAGGGNNGGGGGAGGLLYKVFHNLNGGTHAVTIGVGGVGVYASTGGTGGNSLFNTITAYGGLGGVGKGAGASDHGNGGHSGGAIDSSPGGVSNSGYAGGLEGTTWGASGGGGGSGGVGGDASAGGNYGAGTSNSITGTAVTYAHGGAPYNVSQPTNIYGNGGRGGTDSVGLIGANGNDGIVIIRYYSANSSAIILTPATGEQLPNTSAPDNSLTSSAKGDLIRIRTTTANLIAEQYTPSPTNWVDTP